MGRPRSDIGPRIVQAARARFLVEGVDGASLRTIAADAKTSIGMVYYYFPTKDDLFLAVVEDVYGALLRDLDAAVSIDAPVDERLRRASERVGSASVVELDVIRLVVREAIVSSSRLDRLFERFLRGHIPLLAGTLLEGVESGDIDPRLPTPLLLISALALLVFPQILRRSLGQRAPVLVGMPEGGALAAQLVDLLMHGIAPRHARPDVEDAMRASAERADAPKKKASSTRRRAT